jgi:hypothetical protein
MIIRRTLAARHVASGYVLEYPGTGELWHITIVRGPNVHGRMRLSGFVEGAEGRTTEDFRPDALLVKVTS